MARQRENGHLILGRQGKSMRKSADGCWRRYREVIIKETSPREKV